jgi:(E)-4-hydroxy-3-methylbut-2-enyl-diphosphate synthase
VREAGNGTYGDIKSAIGIGILLLDGIVDTICVSLTEDPVAQIAAAYAILQACGKQFKHAEYIACPSCSRTQFDIQHVFNEIKNKTSHLNGMKIAILGGIVNGVREMDDADFGYISAGGGKINLYHRNLCVKTKILEQNAAAELLKLLENAAGHEYL